MALGTEPLGTGILGVEDAPTVETSMSVNAGFVSFAGEGLVSAILVSGSTLSWRGDARTFPSSSISQETGFVSWLGDASVSVAVAISANSFGFVNFVGQASLGIQASASPLSFVGQAQVGQAQGAQIVMQAGFANWIGQALIPPSISAQAGFVQWQGEAQLGFLTESSGFVDWIGDAHIQALATLGNAAVLNVALSEVTLYTHFDFQGIVTLAGKQYGFRSDGFYEIRQGNDFDDTVVSGRIMTKATDFGNFHSKNVPYLYLNSDTATRTTPIVDDIAASPHISGFGGRKTHLARGVKGRYWQFKIEDIVFLSGIEMLQEEKRRRVK